MIPWFLTDFALLARERRALEELLNRVDWLTSAEWGLAGSNMVIDFEITAHGFPYKLRLEYPTLFDAVVPTVRPLDGGSRLSGHQYGPGGPLCLEYRSDNWHSGLTGSDLIESAYRLLYTENPNGGTVGQEQGVVSSDHSTTLGQDLRSSPLRFFAGLDSRNWLAQHSGTESGSVRLSLRFHEDCGVILLRSIRIGEEEHESRLPPDDALGSSDRSGILVQSLQSPAEGFDVSKLPELLASAGDDAPNAQFVVTAHSDGELYLACRRKDGDWIAATTVPVTQQQADRTPHQYNTLLSKSVAIVGCGSLGSKVAVSLARMGVRNFLLVDDDVFLPENIERNELDWVAVARHKTSALAHSIVLVAPGSTVKEKSVRLTGQESSAAVSAIVTKLAAFDVIVDATANSANFTLLSAAAKYGKTPLVAAEIFGGGRGGLVLRAVPGVDPPPDIVRRGYLKYCEDNPAPDVPMADYDLSSDDGKTLTASDADVGVIANYVVRIVTDLLVNSPVEHRYPIYLIGLSKWWVFDEPFDTRPVTVPTVEWSEDPSPTEEETTQGASFIRDLLEKNQE